MRKRNPLPGNRPCIKCGGHVCCSIRKGQIVRICDECGFTEPDRA
jgi:hypothetical protein